MLEVFCYIDTNKAENLENTLSAHKVMHPTQTDHVYSLSKQYLLGTRATHCNYAAHQCIVYLINLQLATIGNRACSLFKG